MTNTSHNPEDNQPDVATTPNEAADPHGLLEKALPRDILRRFEVYSYRNAAVILSQSYEQEFNDLISALRNFEITTEMIRTAGGNESEIPKLVSEQLRPKGWAETTIKGDLLVTIEWKEDTSGRADSKKPTRQQKKITRPGFLDGHKIDYVKNKVAFDLEWNSKDQTFDRDLYAFSAFFQCSIIDVGVLLTRSQSLNPVFRELGPALRKNGSIDMDRNGNQRMTHQKYGASTTWMGKLLYRLNTGRNGGCPVLAIGIQPECITDWEQQQ